MRALLRVWTLASLAVWPAARDASAETLVHLKKTVWGCVDPNVTPAINDYTGHHQWSSQWIARTRSEGHCVIITPKSLWAIRSPDFDGMTYLGYRGTTGKPGSFWVPTAAIAFGSSAGAAQPPAPPAPPIITMETLAPPKLNSAPEVESPAPEAQPPIPAQTTSSPPAASPGSGPPAVTASPTPTPDEPNDGDGSFEGGALAILALLAVAWMARRPRRRKATTEGHAKAPTGNGRPGITVRAGSFRRTAEPSHQDNKPVGLPSITPSLIWYPHGKAVTVAGATVAEGMVYVGSANGFGGGQDASFIDPALPVASTSASAASLGYWPSYRALTPECRRRYLEWLGSRKREPDTDIGYVFLYFYGLERRLLLDAPDPEEVATLVAEIKRLRRIYAGNNSFDGYSRRLLKAVAFLQGVGTDSIPSFVPDLTASVDEMPISLKVAIAREIVAGRPLGFELAAAALLGLREFWSVHRYILDKSRPAFLAVLRPRFEAAFQSGFLVRNRKDSKLKFIYRGASAGLEIDLVERAGLRDLPDPTALTWTKLFTVAGAVAEEIAPYAKALAHHPDRAMSLHALLDCPPELRDAVAPEARLWLENLPSPAAVPFGKLAGHAIGTAAAKWTARHHRQTSEALVAVGYAMEPDPDNGAEHLEDDTLVQVFRCADATQSRAIHVAGVAAMLLILVARTTEGGAEKVAHSWLSRLPSRLSLTLDQGTRLRARLAWLATGSVSLAKARRMLGEATPEEREFCAWFATTAAVATGVVGKHQVAVLEAIHDTLAVPQASLYAALHQSISAATIAADEPVLVTNEVQETLHPIRSPTLERAGDEPDRLARIRAETETVAAMLADIFVDEETPEALESAENGPLHGLGAEHAALLTRLLTRPEWRREEFESVVSTAGLMPDGAMEAINEWAFDRHGNALLEDGDPILVNRSLLPIDPATAAAR